MMVFEFWQLVVPFAVFRLNFRWFPEIQNIFYKGNKQKWVPNSQNPKKLEKYFNCASTLMTQNLQHLGLQSIEEYTTIISGDPVSGVFKFFIHIYCL